MCRYAERDFESNGLKDSERNYLKHKNSGSFSTMADETTNHEQVVIVIRHVDTELVAHGDFIGFNMVDSVNATTLTGVIKDCLLRMNFALNSCRGQCYDVASNMSGARSGVVKQISYEEQRPVYILTVMDMPLIWLHVMQ